MKYASVGGGHTWWYLTTAWGESGIGRIIRARNPRCARIAYIGRLVFLFSFLVPIKSLDQSDESLV